MTQKKIFENALSSKKCVLIFSRVMYYTATPVTSKNVIDTFAAYNVCVDVMTCNLVYSRMCG